MSEEFEKLDSPLVVHKETDASYLETANKDALSVSNAEEKEASANLVRHRFRRVKKRRKAPWFILVVVIIVAVVCGLYFSGVIGNRKETPTEPTTKGSYLDVTENKFENVITVKGTYIFFEGEELSGTEDLERSIKYLDTTVTLTVQDEEADPVFLYEEIIPLLDDYKLKHEEKMIISSGLKSKYETESTTVPASSSAAQSKSKAASE